MYLADYANIFMKICHAITGFRYHFHMLILMGELDALHVCIAQRETRTI